MKKFLKILLKVIIIIVAIFVVVFGVNEVRNFKTGSGPSQELDFMRKKTTINVDEKRYLEDICKELNAQPEYRGKYDPTGMPSSQGVCVTWTKIYYLN